MLYTLTLVSVIFFRIYLLSKGKKRKKNKQDYIKLKSFGTGKETEQNENSAYWTGGDIESDIFDKGNLAKIYKELIQQHQKTHITWLNSQQWIWIYIFPKKSYRWLTGTWKRCSISLIIKKKANQSHSEISPYTCQNGYYEKDIKIQVLVRMWSKGTVVHFGQECK